MNDPNDNHDTTREAAAGGGPADEVGPGLGKLPSRDQAAAPHGDRAPRSSPQTDPTNLYHQEAVGEWVPAEQASERRVNEPGLTDRDRDQRRSTS